MSEYCSWVDMRSRYLPGGRETVRRRSSEHLLDASRPGGQRHQNLVRRAWGAAPRFQCQVGEAGPVRGLRAELVEPGGDPGPLSRAEVLPHDRVPHHGRRALAQLDAVEEVR